MAGLVPAIHAFDPTAKKAWMPATSAGIDESNIAQLGIVPIRVARNLIRGCLD
jgi:hypothetical protein